MTITFNDSNNFFFKYLLKYNNKSFDLKFKNSKIKYFNFLHFLNNIFLLNFKNFKIFKIQFKNFLFFKNLNLDEEFKVIKYNNKVLNLSNILINKFFYYSLYNLTLNFLNYFDYLKKAYASNNFIHYTNSINFFQFSNHYINFFNDKFFNIFFDKNYKNLIFLGKNNILRNIEGKSSSRYILRKLINLLIKKGKKIKAYNFLLHVFFKLKIITNISPFLLILTGLKYLKPLVDLIKIRKAGKIYEVPVPFKKTKQLYISIK